MNNVYHIKKRYHFIKTRGPEFIQHHPNCYVKYYWKQGHFFYFRNINGNIEQMDKQQNINEFINNLKESTDIY